MAWDWDTANIDPDEDDGQLWVPIMPKTLEELVEEPQGMPKTPKVKQLVVSWEVGQFQNMAIYAVLNSPEGVAQANAPLRQAVPGRHP